MGCGFSDFDFDTDPPSDERKTLEETIRTCLSIPEKDIQEAVSLAQEYPRFQDDFRELVRNLHSRRNPKQFVKNVRVITRTNRMIVPDVGKILVKFFTLLGGAKATAKIYTDQLNSMGITHLTNSLFNGVREEDQFAMNVIVLMRSFWWNATDCCLEFGDRLAETNVISCLIKDLQNLGNQFQAESRVFKTSIAILHNSAKNRGKKQIFRDHGLVLVLRKFLMRDNPEIKLISLLTLSYIIEEEDNHLIFANASDFQFLLKTVSVAWGNVHHISLSDDINTAFYLEELLQGLGNLAQNEDNKKLLMEKDVVKQLKPILNSGKIGEKTEATHLVWILAFNKENRAKMEKDKELMYCLERLKGSDHRRLARAAAGALWVLNMDKNVQGGQSGQGHANMQGGSAVPPAPPQSGKDPPPSAPANPPAKAQSPSPPSNPPGTAPPPPQAPQGPSPAGGGQRGHMMISYQWGNQKTLMQVRDRLVSRGFQVWMDVDNMSGSTLQAMAEAVEQAEAVLMCMSPRYKISTNCRTEADYAFKLKKTIIPLLMETNYQPDGWLGILLGTKLFIDFSGKYPFEKKVEDLVKEIGHIRQGGASEVDGPIAAEKARSVASTPKKGVSSWSQKDVHDWLNKHDLSGFPKLQSLSPEKLMFLQKLSQTAPEFFYSSVKTDLEVTALADVMRFNDAINALP